MQVVEAGDRRDRIGPGRPVGEDARHVPDVRRRGPLQCHDDRGREAVTSCGGQEPGRAGPGELLQARLTGGQVAEPAVAVSGEMLQLHARGGVGTRCAEVGGHQRDVQPGQQRDVRHVQGLQGDRDARLQVGEGCGEVAGSVPAPDDERTPRGSDYRGEGVLRVGDVGAPGHVGVDQQDEP